jgi:hypothetical protein
LRHGAGENTFAVKFADLTKLKRRIQIDNGLASDGGVQVNTDARVLTTMLPNAAAARSEQLDAWMQDVEA